jgi:hypothetical protein
MLPRMLPRTCPLGRTSTVVGMCEFLFSARPWLTYGFGVALDESLVERYAERVSNLVLAGIGAEMARPADPVRRPD